jgi:hypothetical protein
MKEKDLKEQEKRDREKEKEKEKAARKEKKERKREEEARKPKSGQNSPLLRRLSAFIKYVPHFYRPSPHPPSPHHHAVRFLALAISLCSFFRCRSWTNGCVSQLPLFISITLFASAYLCFS